MSKRTKNRVMAEFVVATLVGLSAAALCGWMQGVLSISEPGIFMGVGVLVGGLYKSALDSIRNH